MLFSNLISILKEGESELKNYTLYNDPEVSSAASLEKAIKGQISFLEKGSYLLKELDQTQSSALILPDEDDLIQKASEREIAFVSVNDPRIAFAEILDILNPKVSQKEGVHISAVIEKDVHIGSNVSIGANVYIGKDSTIGDHTVIHPGVVIYDKVCIGGSNELHANCVIHSNSKIGKHCVVNSNAVIGSEGFGFVPTKKGWKKMPQTGSVILEDSVEVGTGSTIDRPAVGETIIGSGTKIDNLVQIGHGAIIGKNCAMASQVGIAGGAKLGDGVILAGQVGVANRVKVGSNVIASSKCGIHCDIAPGQVISGFPAISNKLWLRCVANFKKLPEFAKTLKKLNDSV